jgi:hypothetical protein
MHASETEHIVDTYTSSTIHESVKGYNVGPIGQLIIVVVYRLATARAVCSRQLGIISSSDIFTSAYTLLIIQSL